MIKMTLIIDDPERPTPADVLSALNFIWIEAMHDVSTTEEDRALAARIPKVFDLHATPEELDELERGMIAAATATTEASETLLEWAVTPPH